MNFNIGIRCKQTNKQDAVFIGPTSIKGHYNGSDYRISMYSVVTMETQGHVFIGSYKRPCEQIFRGTAHIAKF